MEYVSYGQVFNAFGEKKKISRKALLLAVGVLQKSPEGHRFN
jgi:hypothetical protein